MISDERLQEMREANASFVSEVELAEMARELLALRKAREGFAIVPRKLTAENGAKSALSGEFNLEYSLECHECFGEGCEDCSGEGRWIKRIPVDWTTIKEIWAKGVEHFDDSAPEPK